MPFGRFARCQDAGQRHPGAPLATIEALRWFGDQVEDSVLDPDRLR
jgi:hypothetical protein